MSVDYLLLGKHIKEVRERSQITQQELADRTELSIQFISKIETARKGASLDSLIRIADALGVTLDELLSGNQLNNPTDYQTDIDEIMASCNSTEKRYIYLVIDSLVNILKENSWKITK